MKNSLNYIDLFAGAGGLSEGFIRAGFNPIAHIEIDKASCNTVLTRTAYHYYKSINKHEIYLDYIKNKNLPRETLYNQLPDRLRNSVINAEICKKNNLSIFNKINILKGTKSVDLIIGGPPCQAYSVAGRSRDKMRMVGDKRNYLYKEYAKYLEYFQPKYFVFENVTGLLSAKALNGESYLKMMLSLFKRKGYNTEYKVIEAKDFGVLQNRKRVILIGKKGNDADFYPDFDKWNPDVTVREIFMDLPALQAGEGDYNFAGYNNDSSDYLLKSNIKNGLDFTTYHVARPHTKQDKEIYKIATKKWIEKKERLSYNDLPEHLKTHNNRESFLDRFKVVADDLPMSQTVVAHISKDGHYYIHPDIKQNRSLTPREAARLQSFPDDYYFESVTEKPSRTAAFKQIGNAVPPLLSYAIAKELKKLLVK